MASCLTRRLFAAAAALCFFLWGTPEAVAADERCQSCHRQGEYVEAFRSCAHGSLSCTACHVSQGDLETHIAGRDRRGPTDCGRCHRDVALRYRRDVHYLKFNLLCRDCHYDIHTAPPRKKDPKETLTDRCTACHAAEDYALSGHGRALREGKGDAASCADCHGLHNIPLYEGLSGRDAARAAYTRRCQACHGDARLARRHDFSTGTVAAYAETYHGKALNLGYPRRGAGCADCHDGHNILPPGDPASALGPERLLKACRRCHDNARFAILSYRPHPDPDGGKGDAYIRAGRRAVGAVGTGVLAFFWLHGLIFWYRSVKEGLYGKARAAALLPPPPGGGEAWVRRFGPLAISLHLALMGSFFALALTGFPLRYAEAAWAKAVMDAWGGAYRAALVHRAAAVVLVIAGVVALTRLFLLRRRLGGPSPLPGRGDLDDLTAVSRWFVRGGDPPAFGRWTYWEKGDILVAAGGLLFLGITGLVLWSPGTTSLLMPGHLMNVAAFCHSDGAFYVSLYFLTVHLFHAHGLPFGFPLGTAVFTGRHPLGVLRAYRGREYERLRAEGLLPGLTVGPAGFKTRAAAVLLSLLGIHLGLVILALLIWSSLF
ncbi:MAG TPA: cytochrome c3 family protein [Syntrophales bacterium]|nr:cytochrome c3 family protein [Syntrophales bacterium]HRS87378.1 cytochrome c3 family protein [Syntrophales bacterium]HRV42981.1 cytochrome c3 family protein [Syntrophales bacterium]